MQFMTIPALSKPTLRFQALRIDPDPDGSVRVRIYAPHMRISKGRNYPEAPAERRVINPGTVEVFAPHDTDTYQPGEPSPQRIESFESLDAEALSQRMGRWRLLIKPDKTTLRFLVQAISRVLAQTTALPEVAKNNCLDTLRGFKQPQDAQNLTWRLPHYQATMFLRRWLSQWTDRLVRNPDYLELTFSPATTKKKMDNISQYETATGIYRHEELSWPGVWPSNE